MQQRSLQQVRVSVSLIFLIHGLIIGTWASRIPAFQTHLHLSPAVLGRSLMMAAIGSVLAMPAAGWQRCPLSNLLKPRLLMVSNYHLIARFLLTFYRWIATIPIDRR